MIGEREYLIAKEGDEIVAAVLSECHLADALSEGGLTAAEVAATLGAMLSGEVRQLAPNVFVWAMPLEAR